MKKKVENCRHDGNLFPSLTEDLRFVEAYRCPDCDASWWLQFPVEATAQHIDAAVSALEGKA